MWEWVSIRLMSSIPMMKLITTDQRKVASSDGDRRLDANIALEDAVLDADSALEHKMGNTE